MRFFSKKACSDVNIKEVHQDEKQTSLNLQDVNKDNSTTGDLFLRVNEIVKSIKEPSDRANAFSVFIDGMKKLNDLYQENNYSYAFIRKFELGMSLLNTATTNIFANNNDLNKYFNVVQILAKEVNFEPAADFCKAFISIIESKENVPPHVMSELRYPAGQLLNKNATLLEANVAIMMIDDIKSKYNYRFVDAAYLANNITFINNIILRKEMNEKQHNEKELLGTLAILHLYADNTSFNPAKDYWNALLKFYDDGDGDINDDVDKVTKGMLRKSLI